MLSGSQVMASYMALKQGWVDGEGKVLPIQFESKSISLLDMHQIADESSEQSSIRSRWVQVFICR